MNQNILNYDVKPLEGGDLPPHEDKQPGVKATIIRRASHEIQGAFFSVASAGAMIKFAVENGEETKVLLGHLMDACQTFKYKLSNFLEYTRYDAGLLDTRLEVVSIRPLFKRVINESRVLASENNIKISLFISDAVPDQLHSDEFRVALICTNLLSNAINFSKAGSSVSIRVEIEEVDKWMICVEDKGEGIAPEKLSDLLNPLFLEGKEIAYSVGMGLIVTRYLIEDVLGGKLIVASKPQAGTCCKVILPLFDNSVFPGMIESKG